MKTCNHCKTEKPETDFFKQSRSKDGLQPRCKACANKYYKKPDVMARYVARNKINTSKNRKLFKDLKDSLSCACCPESSSSCLDFHHLDPSTKERCISNMIGTHCWETVLKEIAKCVCVCRNCHSKIHAGEITLPE